MDGEISDQASITQIYWWNPGIQVFTVKLFQLFCMFENSDHKILGKRKQRVQFKSENTSISF